MRFAQFGIVPALKSTGEVAAVAAADPGWTLSMPGALAYLQPFLRRLRPQLLVGTWSLDAAAAAADPGGYQRTLDGAIRRWLSPADGVSGVIFLQMPQLEPVPKIVNPSTAYRAEEARVAGISAWNKAVQESANRFPGKVLYLPVASSVELDGHYTNWLPPPREPSAPRKDWVRVRPTDGIHLCAPGITRYTAPVLEDLTQLFHLPPANPRWWISYGIAVRGGRFLACPDDHPPG
jgi:hypothetical protein